jgi:hypothetical protein
VSPLIGPIENPAALFRELLAQGRRKTDDCQLSGAAVHAEEWDTGYSTASEELVRHHVLQRANIILRHVPILAFAPFKLFVVDGFAKSLKCVGKVRGLNVVDRYIPEYPPPIPMLQKKQNGEWQ